MAEPFSVFVMDPDPAARAQLTQTLIRLGHDVYATGHMARLLPWVETSEDALLVIEGALLDQHENTLNRHLKKRQSVLPILILGSGGDNFIKTDGAKALRLPKSADVKTMAHSLDKIAAFRTAAAKKTPCPLDDNLGATVSRHLRDYFDAHENGMPASGLYDRIIREVEKPLITLTLSATRGNQIKAADVLGLNRNTLHKKIQTLDIKVVRGAP